jgi:type VI secretion system FHA domain protein
MDWKQQAARASNNMAIKLRVISEHYRELGENRSRVFGVNGGTVGRAPGNDWILPDPRRVVSSHHFEVQFHGGKYWLIDTSTNGVFVNDADDPASVTGRIELHDGDRLRVGDYDILVSVDSRIDFLPSTGDEHSAAKHLDADIGHNLDLDSLFSPRDTGESGSLPVGNAFGVRLDAAARANLLETLQRSVETLGESSFDPSRTGRIDSVVPGMDPAAGDEPAPPPVHRPVAPGPGNQEWALSTRRIPREELEDALARRKTRVDARERSLPFHQQASTWTDLRSAVQAFCRGAGIDPATLSPEAQAMLPLVAGQLLREAVVGLNDILRARASGAAGAALAALPLAPGSSSNPLRSSASIEQALQRLFESHGRLFAGPVDSLRDVLQDTRDHESALAAGMKAGLDAVLGQLAPANVADQFEQGRSRQLAPGQDPRPRYWEHYSEFYRLLVQQAGGSEEMPRAFTEAFDGEYARVRAELRQKRPA